MLKPGLTILILLLAGCDRTEHTVAAPEVVVADAAHNARNSLDWAGTYQGLLPCADCEAINSTVSLNSDGSYQLSQVYLGKSTQVFEQQGQFSWNPEGNTVILDTAPPTQFFVGENQLFMLDQQGKRIEGELAARYRLQKKLP